VVAGPCCITCSDQAQEVSVVSVDQDAGLALVAVDDTTEQIDISLIDGVAPGDLLLVHGGVALERLAEL
jgi:hydrogenase maturation factor